MSEPTKQHLHHHLGTVTDHSSASSIRSALENCACAELDWRMDNLDAASKSEEDLEKELKRLEALRCYRILDTDRKDSFERLTALAARIFDVPICLVSLVDLGRQWFASNRGLGDVRETPRKVAFCAHAILSDQDVFIVPHALEDDRFKDNGLVTGPPHIRFYAGAPLVTPDGYKLGTLCIIDNKPHPGGLSLIQKQNLREIADMVMEQIESTKTVNEKIEKDRARMIACTAHDLITPLTSIQLNIGLLSEDESLKKHLSASQQEHFENTKECVEIMSNICLQSIKTFRGENMSSKSLADLGGHKEGTIVISKVLESLKHIMSAFPKKVPIIMHADDDVPPIISGDVMGIFRSSLNFLTNACKVSEHGSIDFHIYAKNGQLVFECVDSGPGVAIEHTSSLFSDEGGLKLSQEIASGGFGLGLQSVSQLISSAGGIYGYHRRGSSGETPAEGSVFWFSIPLIEHKSSRASSLVSINSQGALGAGLDNSKHGNATFTTTDVEMAVEKVSERTINSNKRKMGAVVQQEVSVENVQKVAAVHNTEVKRRRCALIIDDSVTIRKVFERALVSLGFEVRQAENGLVGLEEMKGTVYDIVLCDFLMPIMDGVDCIQHYREWERTHRKWFHQFVIGISAHADSEDAQRGIKVGMNKFVQKPLRLKYLKELMGSQELQKVSNALDVLALDVKAAPFCLFNDDIYEADESTKSANSSLASTVNDILDFRMKCLIVEDSRSIRKAMTRIVQRRGWQVCIAQDGKEGLRMLKIRNWDVVFMDDQLPLLSGSACVAIFREWENENRASRQGEVYMVSANCNPNVSSDVPPGFDGLIGKPFKPSSLFTVLDAAENRKNSKDKYM